GQVFWGVGWGVRTLVSRPCPNCPLFLGEEKLHVGLDGYCHAIRGAMDAHVLCCIELRDRLYPTFVPAYDAWRSIPKMIPLSSVLLTARTIIQYVGMYMTVKAGAEGLSSAAENWRAPQVPLSSLQSPVDYINTVISLASAGATAYQSYKGKE
ncbi:5310_t:CDS:2, partial [Funneliformis caledonium]